jgi:hypothetical protein
MSANAKSPMILGGCGCLSLIASLVLFASAFFVGGGHFSSFKRGMSSADAIVWRNTREGRTGPLAEHYVGFEFRYPKSWVLKPQGSDETNFVAIERKVDGATYENLNVGYFATAGSKDRNLAIYPQLIAQLETQFGQQFSGLKKVHEGARKVGSYEGWEGLFTSTTIDGGKSVDVYTRVILLPTPDGTKGVALLMMGTSLSPDLHSPEDLGEKGDLPAILESFQFRD